MTFRDLLTMNSMLLKIFAGEAIINSWLKQKKNPFNDDGDIIFKVEIVENKNSASFID